MGTTVSTPTTSGTTQTQQKETKAQRIALAFNRKRASVKVRAQSIGDSLSERYDSVKDKLAGTKSAHDYSRRYERFEEMIAACKDNRLLATAVLEAETELGKLPKPMDGKAVEEDGGKTDFTDAHTKLGILTTKLTEAREAAEAKANEARTAQPRIAATIDMAKEVLDERRMPEAERKVFAGKLAMLEYMFAKGESSPKDILSGATELQNAIVRAGQTAANLVDEKMKRHAELSRQLAGSTAGNDTRLAIAGMLEEAENAIRSYDYTNGDLKLEEATRALGTPKTLPTAAGLVAPIEQLIKQVGGLLGKVIKTYPDAKPTEFGGILKKDGQALIGRLQSCLFAVEKGGDSVAVDVERMRAAGQTEYDRLNKAFDGHGQFVVDAPKLKVKLEQDCAAARLKAATFYESQGAPKGSTGPFDPRIDEILQRFSEDMKSAVSVADLHLDAAQRSLDAILQEIASGPTMSPDQLAYDSTVNRFVAKIAELDTKAKTLMENNSDAAIALGVLTAPAQLRREGEQLTKTAPPPSERTERAEALTGVITRVQTKIDEIANAAPKPINDPEKLRAACNRLMTEITNGINAAIQVVVVDDKKTISKLGGDQRKALKAYGEALKKDAALLAAPAAPDGTSDVALLADTVKALSAFRSRVAAFEKMVPGDKYDKNVPTFKDVTDLVTSIEKKLGFPVFAARQDMTTPWQTTVTKYKSAPTKFDPAVVVPELTKLKQTVTDAITVANQESQAASTMATRIEDMAATITLAKAEALQRLIASAPTAFAALVRDMKTAADAIRREDKPNQTNFDNLKVRFETLCDPAKVSERSKGEQTAKTAEKDYQAAKFNLEEVLAVDIRLLEEKAKEMKGEAKTELEKQLKDMRKATEGALATLKQNRDVEAADSMRKAILSRLKNMEDSPLGNTTRNRNELKAVLGRWVATVETLHRRLDAVPADVQKACTGDQPALDAAGALQTALVKPVKELFRTDAFNATFKRIEVADETNVLDAREDALREVRRIRRLMVSDANVRMLAMTPFVEAKVSFRTIDMALWDLETNLLTSDTV